MTGEIIRTAAVIIVVSVLIISLRTRLNEYSFLLLIATVCVVLLMVLGNLFSAFSKIRDLFNKSGNINEYFTVALKALGISYITTFAADSCRDFGLSALAQTSEIVGKIAIFILSLPLVTSILEAALRFVGL